MIVQYFLNDLGHKGAIRPPNRLDQIVILDGKMIDVETEIAADRFEIGRLEGLS